MMRSFLRQWEVNQGSDCSRSVPKGGNDQTISQQKEARVSLTNSKIEMGDDRQERSEEHKIEKCTIILIDL